MKHFSSHLVLQAVPRLRKLTVKMALRLTSLALIGVYCTAQAQTIANPNSITRVSSFEYNTQGLLSREVIEPDNPQQCLSTTHDYDGFGNKRRVTTAACAGASGAALSSASTPRTASTTYTADGRFPAVTANSLGHTETKTYDLRFGTPISLTGPNGLTTTWTYDGFGRKTRETRADGTWSRWQYNYCTDAGANCPTSITAQGAGSSAVSAPVPQIPVWVITEQSCTAANQSSCSLAAPNKRQYHDALNRVIRAETTGFDGGSGGGGAAPTLVQDTEYNALGQIRRKSNTYDSAQPASAVWVAYTYDALGRLIKEEAPDDAASSTGGIAITEITYNGLSSTVKNSAGQIKTTVKDALGRTALVTDALGGTVSYDYDALGQLIQTDAAGNITKIQYNLRGQKIRMDDPAMGVWTYEYNVFGELVYQSDSLGQSSTIAYDSLGRMRTRTEPDLVSTWTYDNCAKGIGKLCQASSDNGYSRTHAYDSQGRGQTTTTVLDSASAPMVTSVNYEANTGRVTSKSYPTGYQVSYQYTYLGFLKSVTGQGITGTVAGFTKQAKYEILAINAQGQITSYRYGNQVITNKTYDAQTGRLMGITGTKDGLATGGIQQNTYQYDSLSNLTARGDVNTGVQETFLYDNLNRLSIYNAIGGSVTSQDASSNVEVRYDARGNITYKSDVGRYWYDPQRPNRLTNITLEAMAGAAPLTGTRALAYAFDDYKAGARTLSTGMGAASGMVMGNGNLMYTVSQDNTTGRHSVRWETYTSFNMPYQLALNNLGSAQTSTAATLTGASCVEGALVNGECVRTLLTTSKISWHHCYAYSGATLVGTQCNWTQQEMTVLGNALVSCSNGSAPRLAGSGASYGYTCTPEGYKGRMSYSSLVYSCPYGQTVSDGRCMGIGPVNYSAPATAVYSCPAGMTLVGSGATSSCEYVHVSNVCPSGYALHGSTCRQLVSSSFSWSNGCILGDTVGSGSYYYRCLKATSTVQACSAHAVANALASVQFEASTGMCVYTPMVRCPAGSSATGVLPSKPSGCWGTQTQATTSPPTASFTVAADQTVNACAIGGSSGYALLGGQCVKLANNTESWSGSCISGYTLSDGSGYGCMKANTTPEACHADAVANRLLYASFSSVYYAGGQNVCSYYRPSRCPAGSTSVGTSQPGYSCYIDRKPATQLAPTCSGSSCTVLASALEPPRNTYSCPAGTTLSGSRCFSNTITSSTSTNRTLTFIYGPEHQRIKQRTQLDASAPANMSASAGTVYYLHGQNNDLGYEKEVKDNGLVEHKHYLSAGGIVFAMQITRTGNTTPGGVSGSAKPTQSLQYLHHDHLGSVAVITDDTGSVVERLAYDPWGKRRFPNGTADTADSIVGLTLDRGYTMHEHLDEMGVIHMNGRIYDPLIGRFMSADPFIQAPENLQSHNRFAYVMNNPLAYTDPSGYFSLRKLMGFISFGLLGNSKVGRQLITLGACIMGGPIVCGGVTAMNAYVSGASLGQSIKAGLIAWGTAEGFQWAGQQGPAGVNPATAVAANSFERYASHALVGCASSVASGGGCGSGAVSGLFGKFTTNAIGSAPGVWNAGKFIATVIAGGVGSVIAGGKFENGATTAAFGYLFNQLAHQDNSKPNLAPNLERTSYAVAAEGQFSMYAADGKLIDRVPFTSGRDGVTDPTVPDRGPIPPGTYVMDPKNVTFNGPNTLLSGDWGAMRVSLVPSADTNTFGRSGFYIHGGFAPGSAGCIDLGTPTDYRVLGQFRNLRGPIQIVVR